MFMYKINTGVKISTSRKEYYRLRPFFLCGGKLGSRQQVTYLSTNNQVLLYHGLKKLQSLAFSLFSQHNKMIVKDAEENQSIHH